MGNLLRLKFSQAYLQLPCQISGPVRPGIGLPRCVLKLYIVQKEHSGVQVGAEFGYTAMIRAHSPADGLDPTPFQLRNSYREKENKGEGPAPGGRSGPTRQGASGGWRSGCE